MGNTFIKTPTSPANKSLLNQLRQRNLSDLIECLTILNEDYPDHHNLTYSQFEDVFGSMVDDPEPFFLELQNENEIDGTVDVYETLAAFAVFVKEQFEKKVEFIFRLFDFDNSKSLETSELALTMQSAVRGLCKFVHITPPLPKALEIEAKNIFSKVDLDNNKKIVYEEFMNWIRNHYELQEFLLRYLGIQTFDNMKKRFDSIHSLFLHYFIRSSGAHAGDFADEKALKEYLQNEQRLNLSNEDIEFIFEVLHSTSAAFIEEYNKKDMTLISRRAFEHFLKAWCAFSASDINGDNMLSVNELYAMLLLYEGQEPSEQRVKQDMKEIDQDGSGEITRYEWIKHLCLTDKDGRACFRNNLRILFERYDKDNSGTLSLDETKELVKEAFRDYMKRRRESSVRKNVDDMIDSLTKQIFEELDTNNSTNIDWQEFKDYMNVSIDKIEKLKEFLELNL